MKKNKDSSGQLSVLKSSVFRNILGAVGIITLLTIFSRVIGFLRWIAQASYVGTDVIADSYASANQIPNLLFEVVAGGALAGITVPLLAIPIANKIQKDINKISSALLTWTLIILIPLACIVFLFSDFIATLLPVNKNTDFIFQIFLTSTFLKVFAFQIPFYGIGVVLTGILQAHKKFLWPVITPILSSITVIATYYIFGYVTYGINRPNDVSLEYINLLAWGTTIGVLMLSLPLFFPVRNLGVKFRFVLRIDKELSYQALSLGFAGIGALLAQQISVFVTLFLAKSAGEIGTINVFQYTQAVYVLPYAILVVPIATAIFPHASEYIAKGDIVSFRNMCISSTKVIIFSSFIGIGGLIVVSSNIERIFEKLTPVVGMSLSLISMAPSLFGFALIFHISRCLYALKMGGVAVKYTAIGWIGVIVFQIILVKYFVPIGVNTSSTLMALGIGQSIGMTISGILLLIGLGQKIEISLLWEVIKLLVKILPFFVLGTVLGLYVSNIVFLGNSIFDIFLNALIASLMFLFCVLPASLFVKHFIKIGRNK